MSLVTIIQRIVAHTCFSLHWTSFLWDKGSKRLNRSLIFLFLSLHFSLFALCSWGDISRSISCYDWYIVYPWKSLRLMWGSILWREEAYIENSFQFCQILGHVHTQSLWGKINWRLAMSCSRSDYSAFTGQWFNCQGRRSSPEVIWQEYISYVHFLLHFLSIEPGNLPCENLRAKHDMMRNMTHKFDGSEHVLYNCHSCWVKTDKRV